MNIPKEIQITSKASYSVKTTLRFAFFPIFARFKENFAGFWPNFLFGRLKCQIVSEKNERENEKMLCYREEVNIRELVYNPRK